MRMLAGVQPLSECCDDSMKTYNSLYHEICSFENLLLAAKKAQRGKKQRSDVARFNFHLESELFRLHEELRNQSYRPGLYHQFYIYEPKPRIISAAPYRDRVVHHALCNIIEPLFEKSFICDSYACRVGKGTHRAVERFTQFCRKSRYVLKCDIQKYFPSIDHAILRDLIGSKIRCKGTMWLVEQIIKNSGQQERVLVYFDGDDLFTPIARPKGLPIGNLTSQFFANIYLNGFDHFVKEKLGCKYYIRYCDDFVVLSDDKAWLHDVKREMFEYLVQNLRLVLHPRKSTIFPVADGTDFLGYRIFPTHRLVRKGNAARAKRRLKRLQTAYSRGDIPIEQVSASVKSWVAHLSHADTHNLRKNILSQFTFSRAKVSDVRLGFCTMD